MVAPMNESDLLSPDHDSVAKKEALIPNLNTNNYICNVFRGALKEPSHVGSFKALQVYLLSILLCSYFSI